MTQAVYPRPKKNGGILIRRVISLLREFQVQLPLKKLAIACSGGSDSMSLAHLFIKYGRKIVNKDNIVLVHINHGWRGQESDCDETFVKQYAEKMGIEFRSYRLKQFTENELKGKSLESVARLERKEIFNKLNEEGFLIFTAHHSDDIAETLIWRLCQGQMETHNQGILFQTKNEIRPFLTSTKSELRHFLNEENQEWREDRTNHEGELLRSKMRQSLMPEIERIFPQAVKNIVKESLKAQKENRI